MPPSPKETTERGLWWIYRRVLLPLLGLMTTPKLLFGFVVRLMTGHAQGIRGWLHLAENSWEEVRVL